MPEIVDRPFLAEIERLVVDLATAGQISNHRCALVLAGSHAWCLAAAQAGLHALALEDSLWVSTQAPPGAWAMRGGQAHEALGREVDAVVFDAHCGFDLDAFGAVSGAVRGGGLLVLLAPSLVQWPEFVDPENARVAVAGFAPVDVTGRFLQRLVQVIEADPHIAVVEQGARIRRPTQRKAAGAAPRPMQGECRTPDQLQAVEAIVRVATGHRRRPVVLTSDRGRGKSAAFGIAAARLLERGVGRIVVTAPRLAAVEPVFAHAHRLLPAAAASRSALHLGESKIEFVPPDELVLSPQPARLVLVDEAAAIPTPLLVSLLGRYARIAFATTVHGYEGTGRGFALRFHRVLDQRSRGWRAVRLETPIRWAPDDPLERFVFRALLLDACVAPDRSVAGTDPAACVIEHADRDSLTRDEPILSQLFGLLVLAHYRTRPYDLRYLLDGPNLSVYLMRNRGHVVGTALVAREGGFDADSSRQIWEGRIRPHGHLLPESLAAHAGLEQAPRLRCARIMRIAIHPAAQGRGLGTRLVRQIVSDAAAQGLDYLGSSFGATVELLRFWSRCHLLPVRVGVKRGAASGAHSAIVLFPLSDAGGALYAQARQRFLEHLPHELSDPLRDLEPELARQLLQHQRLPPPLDRQDWRDVLAFAFGRRRYEACLTPVWKLVCAALADPGAIASLKTPYRDLLVMRVLQKRDWSDVAKALELTGRTEATTALRQALRPLVMRFANEDVRCEAERLAAASSLHFSPGSREQTQDSYS